MTKKFDSLNDAFDIAGEVVSKQIETKCVFLNKIFWFYFYIGHLFQKVWVPIAGLSIIFFYLSLKYSTAWAANGGPNNITYFN